MKTAAAVVGALALCSMALGMIQPPFHPNRSSILDTRACRPGYDNYTFCDTSLSIQERAQAAIKLMQDGVKPQLLTARGWPQGNIQGVPSLGIPPLDKGQNSLHGVQTLCIEDRCATSFPMPNALGASFNRSLWLAMGDVIGEETRIAYLTGCPEASTWSGRPPAGLDTWSPTINQPRDPRWGRSQEVVSESPLLLSDYAVAYTKGVQEGEDSRYLRAVSTLKHWVAYSLEDSDGYTRHNFCAEVSDYDLGATYFPMFKAAVQDAKAASIMSSYNAISFQDSANKTCVPTSASAELRHVLRDEWGFNGYQTSDSGAIADIYTQHKYVDSGALASCVGVRDGQCDIDSGSVYWDNLASAVAAGDCEQSDVDLALQHTFEVRVRLGLFDPVENQPYWQYPTEDFGKNSSQQLALEGSRQSAVLLKNTGGLLPLKAGQKVAVIGPNADSQSALVASYLGQLCPGDKWDDLSCLQTVQQAISSANNAAGGSTTYVKGCDINSSDKSGFDAAVAAAKAADAVVMVMGIDQSIEGESHDRTNIDLPGVQHDLVQAVLAAQPKTAVVFLNGGVVDVSAEKASVPAIVEAFYPGYHGAQGLSDVIFGGYNPSGRLPFTVYYSNYTGEVNMTSMCMGCAPGRTYRYFGGPVVYPFGAGLSYTTFSMSWSPQPPALRELAASRPVSATKYTVTVTNTGKLAGDVVVMAMWKPQALAGADLADYPLKLDLFNYTKVHLAAGGSTQVTFDVDQATLRVVHPRTGDVLSAPGDYELIFTTNTMAVAELAGDREAAMQRSAAPAAVEVLRAPLRVQGGEAVLLERFPMPRPGRE